MRSDYTLCGLGKWIACAGFAVAACGGVSNSRDAATDTPDADQPRCNPSAPFGPPVALTSLNTDQHDEMARLSFDERTLYFSSARPGGLGNWDLYTATRADTATMFGNAIPINGVNTNGLERGPSMTADGLKLYALIGATPDHDIGVATRSTVQAPFGPLAALIQPNSSSDDADPFILPSGAALYFASVRGGNYDIYRGPRAGTGFEAPSLVTGVDVVTSSSEANPVASSDELVLYFGSDRPGGAGNHDIYRASRASTADGFGAAINLSSLNTGGLEVPTWVSADDCELYITRLVPGPAGGNYDLYVSVRGR